MARSEAQGVARPNSTRRRITGPDANKIKRASETLMKRRISSLDVDDGALAALYELHHQRLILEYERARKARELVSGEWEVPLPPEYSDEDREAYGGLSSDHFMIPLHTVQRLAAKRCRVMRPTSGISRAAQKASSTIEVFIEGLMSGGTQLGGFPWPDWVENIGIEGISAMKVLPAPAVWDACPTLYDEEGEEGAHLDQMGYDDLPEKRQSEYEQYDHAESGSTRYKRVREHYRVNADGEPDDGSDSWQFDRQESTSYFTDESEQFLGDNPPVVFDLVSRLDFVPINPRFTSSGVEVDGIISRRLYARDTLRARKYKCLALDDAMQPVGPEGGKDGDLYLYEAILKDGRNGHVFIAYQVAGQKTLKGDNGDVAVIDLTAKYKMSRLPVVVRYGWHWSTSDPDRRTIPFPLPYSGDLRRRDTLVAAACIGAMWDGMPSYGQRITPEGSAAAALSGDVDLNITIRPNSIVPIWGELIRLGGNGVSSDVVKLIEHFDRKAAEHAPQPGAFGGDGPQSGVDRQTMGRDMELAHAHILEGARSGYEEAASLALEICSRLGQLPDKPPVSLNVMSTTPTPQPGQTTVQSRVTLSPRACGDNWSVIAEYPHQPGENLAAAAQWQAFASPGVELILREEFRTLAMGDPSPEIFEAKRMLQRWLDTPEGMKYVMEQVTEALADDRLRSILQLQSDQRMTNGQVPTAAMSDIVPAAPQGVAPQVGNPADSAYAGAVAGETQASVGGGPSPLAGLPAAA